MEYLIYPVLLGGGRIARRTALRIYLQYALRAAQLCRSATPADRLFPLWRAVRLPAKLPDALLATALLRTAEEARERDLVPLLYLCDRAYLPFLRSYRQALEQVYIVCDTQGQPLTESAYEPCHFTESQPHPDCNDPKENCP